MKFLLMAAMLISLVACNERQIQGTDYMDGNGNTRTERVQEGFMEDKIECTMGRKYKVQPRASIQGYNYAVETDEDSKPTIKCEGRGSVSKCIDLCDKLLMKVK